MGNAGFMSSTVVALGVLLSNYWVMEAPVFRTSVYEDVLSISRVYFLFWKGPGLA